MSESYSTLPDILYVNSKHGAVDKKLAQLLVSTYKTVHDSIKEAAATTTTDNGKNAAVATALPHGLDLRFNELPSLPSVSQDKGSATDAHSLEAESHLSPSKVFSLLKTQWLGHTLMYSPRISSTQRILTEVFPLLTELPFGLVCVADTQYAGHGRGGNLWSSPPGSLCFTLKISQVQMERIVFIQYLASLALVKAIDGFKYGIRLKWPNDIYAGNDKIGGIVCKVEFRPADKSFDIFAGIGINVANAQPTTCLNAIYAAAPMDERVAHLNLSSSPESSSSSTTISDRAEGVINGQTIISREQVLASFLNTFEKMYIEFGGFSMDGKQFGGNGFEPFFDEYTKYWLHSGQIVTIESDNTRAKIQGLTKSGYLLATDEVSGANYELQPDGNSFDFFKGLVKKKI